MGGAFSAARNRPGSHRPARIEDRPARGPALSPQAARTRRVSRVVRGWLPAVKRLCAGCLNGCSCPVLLAAAAFGQSSAVTLRPGAAGRHLPFDRRRFQSTVRHLRPADARTRAPVSSGGQPAFGGVQPPAQPAAGLRRAGALRRVGSGRHALLPGGARSRLHRRLPAGPRQYGLPGNRRAGRVRHARRRQKQAPGRRRSRLPDRHLHGRRRRAVAGA